MRLSTYILRRVAMLVPVLLGVLVIIFVIAYVIPADPARAWAGPRARADQVEVLAERYHLNDPLHKQIYYYLEGLFTRFDLGVSPTTGRPVTRDLKAFFPATFELALVAFILAILIGIPLGVISALRRNRPTDHFSRVIALTGVSTPLFWSALLLQFLFYYKLGWLPAMGRSTIDITRYTGFVLIDSVLNWNWTAFGDAAIHMILPAATLAFYSMGYLVRITRGSMLEVLEAEYVITARAKGLPRKIVIYRHALKNAIIPPLTVLGVEFGWLLGGTVLLETIFAWPGMGRYAAGSIVMVDLPAVVGYTLVVAMIMLLSNLVVDILYSVIDPRIRVGGKRR
jgi:ABC-type dipeptide/oligopeptide/nickel transport system permease component